MNTIFASEDIATLVANFQPLSILAARPILLRSRSGHDLVNFEQTVCRVTKLLQTSKSRFEKAKITEMLDIEEEARDWLLKDVQHQIVENSSGNYLLPDLELESILASLEDDSSRSCVDTNDFSRKHDISLQHLLSRIDYQDAQSLRRFDHDGRAYICSNNFVESIKARLHDAIKSVGSETCNLSRASAQDLPASVLEEMANELALDAGAEIRVEDCNVTYVPGNYSAAAEERVRQMRLKETIDFATRLEQRGFCVIESTHKNASGDHAFDQDVLDEYGQRFANGTRPHRVTVESRGVKGSRADPSLDGKILLITPARLDQELKVMRSVVSRHAETVWKDFTKSFHATSIIQGFDATASQQIENPELAQLLIRSDYGRQIEMTVREEIERFEDENHGQLVQLLEAKLIIPLHLYSAGVGAIKDATLKQHLDDFVVDHFKREVVPQLVKTAQDQKLLRRKESERQIDKLRQASAEAKSCDGLQLATSKLTKKLKIQFPDQDMIRQAKHRTLQAAIRSMRQMSRGSDVLQNLIWVVLARNSDGLFMSSGKDTSRMIKQCEATGDLETAQKLIRWRDLLKSGQENKDDVEEMKELAREAVAVMTVSS